MSTIYQEYKNRVNYKGSSKREYVNTKVVESINSLINDSQYGFTIEVNGKKHDVAILSTTSTQDYEKANIIAHNEVGLNRGSLFKWNDEYWIILQKMFRPEQPGFNGNAYRCTGTIKWIDDDGRLHEKQGYISSGRTTNSLTYTPDVNYKYDNIIKHGTDWSMIAAVQYDPLLHEEMRFIIKGKAYRVTNIDNVSIDNVSILSMVDDNLLDSDDIINEVAGNSKYVLRLDVESPIKLYAGDVKNIPVSVIYNGRPTEEKVIYTSLDKNILDISKNNMIGRGIGQTKVLCTLEKNKLVNLEIEVNVTDEHITDTEDYFIEGPDTIEWNSNTTYMLSNKDNAIFEVEWLTKVKHSVEWSDNSVTISIKDKYSGSIIIRATYEGKTIEKTVIIQTV